MKKILILFLLLFVAPTKVFAADYKVICDSGGCTGPTSATFYETNLSPGDSITKTIEVKSAYGQTLNLTLTADKQINTDDALLDQIQVTVLGLNNRIRFTGTLKEFLETPSVDLGHLFAFGTRNVEITTTLARFGNPYQSQKAWFDIPIQINVQGQGQGGTGGPGATVSPNPSPTITDFVAGATASPEPEVLGESTPSAQISTSSPGSILGQIKSYLRWWPWLVLLIPILWWIFLLYKRRRNG